MTDCAGYATPSGSIPRRVPTEARPSKIRSIRGVSTRLALGGALAGGCGEVPDPPWVLGEDPLVLALRTEVDGDDLFELFLPADRVRAEPLPGDTITVTPLVADHEGVVDNESLAPHWLLCPREDVCISTLDEPGAGKPCSGWPEERVACSLGSAPVLELEIPPLDPELTLAEHGVLQLAFVAGDPAITTTDACLTALKSSRTASLRGCLLAYSVVTLGPLTALAQLAVQNGIPIGVDIEEDIPLETATIQPNYNPEVEQLVLFGAGREFTVLPDSVTKLPRNEVFGWETVGDPGDIQTYADVSDNGITRLTESLDSALYFTEPDLRETFRQQFTTVPGIDAFTLFVVVSDRRGGQGFARFDFEIGESWE
jgi:hypothetical protein